MAHATKAVEAGGAMTVTAAFGAVAEKAGLKNKDVEAVVTNYMELAPSELKKARKAGTDNKGMGKRCMNVKSSKAVKRPDVQKTFG